MEKRDGRRHDGIRAALGYRDCRWLVLGLAVSSTGVWAYNVALYVYVWEVTNSPAWAAATTLGRFVPAFLVSAYSGVVAERFERRRLLIFTDLACLAVLVAMSALAGVRASAVLVIVLASTISMLGTLYYPATAALTPQIVAERHLAPANALQGVVDNLATIVGPAVGALLLAVASIELSLAIIATSFGVSAWCSSRMRVRSRPTDVTEGGEASVIEQVTVGFKALATSTTAVVLVVANALCYVILGADTVLLVVVSDQRLGLGPDGIGLLLTGIGVGGVLIVGLVNRLAASPRLGTVVLLALVVYTLPTSLLVFISDPIAAFGIQVVRGAGMLAITVLAVTAVQRALPPELISRGVGVLETLSYVGLATGAVIVPVLLALTGLTATLLAFSVGVSLLVAAAAPLARRADRELAARLVSLEPRIEALASLELFAEADRAAIEQLAASAEVLEVPIDTRLVTEGEPSDAFYVVLEGEVAVRISDDRGATIGLGPGEHFGEIGLLDAGPRTANVDALTEALLLRVPGETFVEALRRSAPAPAFLDTARRRLAQTHPTRELATRALVGDGGDLRATERS